jgi:electron transfer flavoprotein alpha subunit
MGEILVLVDHVDGAVRKTTTELLTLARRAGEPAAVFLGRGYEAARETLGTYGAAKVYVAEGPEFDDYLVAPKAEALAQIAGTAQPSAVLMTSSPDGKEIAGRLAVRLDSGVITDAVDVTVVDSELVTTQSAFAGGYTVTARVTHGTPVITVKPNSATPEAAPTTPAEEKVTVSFSDAAKACKVLERAAPGGTRPPAVPPGGNVVCGGRRPRGA